MDKKQVLSFIKRQVDTGVVTPGDISGVLSGEVVENTPAPAKADHSSKIVRAFYIIGAIIVILGVVILLAQNWNELGLTGRVIATLGLGFVAYFLGWMFAKTKQETISQLMFLISVLLAVPGIGILLDGLNIRIEIMTHAIVAAVLMVIYGFTQSFVRNRILVLVLVALGTWIYGAAVALVIDGGIRLSDELIKTLVIVAGVAYGIIAYGYHKMIVGVRGVVSKEEKSVENVLYSIATVAILWPVVTLGGIWNFLAILLIFAGMYLGFAINSRTTLVLSAIFLVGHTIRLTGEYFVDSFGWPIALIAAGIFIIAIGYFTVKFGKKIEG